MKLASRRRFHSLLRGHDALQRCVDALQPLSTLHSLRLGRPAPLGTLKLRKPRLRHILQRRAIAVSNGQPSERRH